MAKQKCDRSARSNVVRPRKNLAIAADALASAAEPA
jgi:hypothetical protein